MKKIYQLFAILVLAFGIMFQTQAQSFLTNGLVAYYPFNGNANDASGNGHNGVVVGNANLTVDRFVVPNKAFHFDGGLDAVTVTNLPANTLTGQTNTVSLWFNWTGQLYNPADPGTYLFNWKIGNVNPNPGAYGLYVQRQASTRFGFGNGYGEVWGITYNEPTFTNEWIHVVGVFVNGDMRQSLLYVNGQEQTCNLTFAGSPSDGPTVSAFADPTSIISGYLSDNIKYHFFGGIDDIRIYNRALSSNEVAQLYAIESGPRVDLIKAVIPSFSYLSLGTNYQLQVSGDATTFTNYGAAFPATNTSMVYPQYFDVENYNKLFFRLQVP